MTTRDALLGQLDALTSQREQLAALVGGDTQSPLIPLQAELAVTIDGIHQRLAQFSREEGQEQAAVTPTPLSSHLPQQNEEDQQHRQQEHGDVGAATRSGGDPRPPSLPAATAVPPAPAAEDANAPSLPSPIFSVGDYCLAPRVFDRRRALATVEEVDRSNGTCLVTWLHPRQRGELVCRYWKEGRNCKFAGPDCPFSHGVEVSLSALLPDSGSNGFARQRGGSSPATTSPAGAAAGDQGAAAWLLKSGTSEDGQGMDDGDRGPETTSTRQALDPNSKSTSRGSATSGTEGVRGEDVDGGADDGSSGGRAWLESLRTGSRVLARYYDRVWYEATVEDRSESPACAQDTATSLAVRFKGFEDDGPVLLPADSAHLAPLEPEHTGCGSGGGNRGKRRGRGGGRGQAGPVDGDAGEASGRESSDLEDAWADATRDKSGVGDGDDGRNDENAAERFFRERVLGDRRGAAGGGAGAGTRAGSGGGRGGGEPEDAYIFGDWEQHTKGFGSRMMNRMGYRRGEGLGKEKQGISRPVPIRVLPERCGLDHLRADGDAGGSQNRNPTKGSKKSKPREGSANRRAGGGGGGGGVFNFLNTTMHTSMNKGKAAAAAAAAAGGVSDGSSVRSSLLANRRIRPVVGVTSSSPSSSSAAAGAAAHPLRKSGVFADRKRGGGGGAAATASAMSQAELRSHLVGAREAEVTLAAKIDRLQETITRNSERDPKTAGQAKQKLEEVRLQMREVKASKGRAETVLQNRGLGSGGGGGGGGKGSRKKAGMFSF